MHYEHIIEVNDATIARPITRTQLWQGLVLRAEQPEPFLDGLDTCTVLERHPHRLERELRFGHTLIRDRVLFTPRKRVRFEIRGRMGLTGDSMQMTVEEPETAALFLRFEYDVALSDAIDEASEEADALRGAYYSADLDTVRLIRRYALAGELD